MRIAWAGYVLGILYSLMASREVVCAAPVPKFSRFIFPTQLDSRWVYRVTVGKDEKKLVYKLSRHEKTDTGTEIVKISLDDPKWASGGTFEVSKSGLSAVSEFPGGAILDPPSCLLKLPHRAGNQWKNKTKVLQRETTESRTAFGPESIGTPCGNYLAIRVESEHTVDGGKLQKETQWYASGVGLVKWVVRDEEWVLVEFSLGKE